MKKVYDKKKLSGVYVIKNCITGNSYIGSAGYIKSRVATHISYLRRNKHHCLAMQNEYNIHGDNNIVFEIIEYCEKNLLREREQYYLDTIIPTYNKNKYSDSRKGAVLSEETRAKIKEKRKSQIISKESYKRGALKRTGLIRSEQAKITTAQKRRKPILQYSLGGEFIREWCSATCAGNALNINTPGIVNCMQGKTRTCFKHIWKYKTI